MAAKPTGLAAFTNKPSLSPEPGPVTFRRRRGQGETVALTVRVTRSDWERLHGLALSEGGSIQELATRGLSLIFAEKGLPGIGT